MRRDKVLEQYTIILPAGYNRQHALLEHRPDLISVHSTLGMVTSSAELPSSSGRLYRSWINTAYN